MFSPGPSRWLEYGHMGSHLEAGEWGNPRKIEQWERGSPAPDNFTARAAILPRLTVSDLFLNQYCSRSRIDCNGFHAYLRYQAVNSLWRSLPIFPVPHCSPRTTLGLGTEEALVNVYGMNAWMNEGSVTYTSLWWKSWQMHQKCGGRVTSHLKCMSRNLCSAACNRKCK